MSVHRFAGVFAAVVLLSACTVQDEGSGIAAKAGPDGSRSFAATGFTGVELAGPDNVIVKRGAAFAVTATGPDSALDKLEVRVENGRLRIARESKGIMAWSDNDRVTVTVTLPQLDELVLSGSGNFDADAARGDSVDVVLSGSGNLTLASAEAKALDVALAGSGDLTIGGGSAERGDVALAGSGDINMKGIKLTSADIALAGSGDIEATATGTAEIAIVGSGDVRLGGGAKCDSSELGSGKASCS